MTKIVLVLLTAMALTIAYSTETTNAKSAALESSLIMKSQKQEIGGNVTEFSVFERGESLILTMKIDGPVSKIDESAIKAFSSESKKIPLKFVMRSHPPGGPTSMIYKVVPGSKSKIKYVEMELKGDKKKFDLGSITR
jgi:hypothetical protein